MVQIIQSGSWRRQWHARSGRPSTSTTVGNIDSVKKIIAKNRLIGIREIAEELEISFGTHFGWCARHETRRCSTGSKGTGFFYKKSVEWLLLKRWLPMRITTPHSWNASILVMIRGFMNLICKPVNNHPNGAPKMSQHRKNHAKFDQKSRFCSPFSSNIEVLFVHQEFLPTGQTVNKEYYLSVLRRLLEVIRKKRPELLQNNSWILHHDNAPSHTALVEFQAEHSTNSNSQAPYSPDMAPCDFFLFPRLKLRLRGRRFESIGDIEQNSLKELKAIP